MKNQVSRPMQIALAAALVFVALWFTVLRPKEPVIEPVAATPVTPAATTPRSDAGGATAETGVGKAVETAKNGAAAADADAKKAESQTGEDDAPTRAPGATKPSAAAKPAGTTPAATTPATKATGAKAEDKTSKAQKQADKVTTKVAADLAKSRAVVVLIWSKTNPEDQELHRRVTKEISRRGGRVRVYLIPVAEVGRYDGLLSGLAIGQTPSTIVIAPNHEAKVLGGLTSTARIDRLTSSAIQIKAPKTTP